MELCYDIYMKIAFFSDCFLDLTGGIVTNIKAEKAELERRGHTVYVFSSAYPRSETELEKLAKEHIFLVPSCKIAGRGVTPIARRPKIVERWILRNHPEVKDFDVFYVHYEAGCSIAGLRLAKALKIYSVQVMHGREDEAEAKLIPFTLRTLVATLLNWFHSWYLPHPIKIRRDNYLADTVAKAKMWTLMVNHANFADIVLTPSEHFRQKLIYYGVDKPIIALPHGIKDDLLGSKPETKTLKEGEALKIIWHSRVSGEKRILPFLEAIRILQYRYKIKNYHLAVYGSGADLVPAKQYAKLNRLNVKFYGNTDFDKIWQALKEAHLDVLVSYHYDTFGMVLLEAIATATPTLIADPELVEILPPQSYALTASPKPADIATALLELIQHPDRVHQMSQAIVASTKSIANSHKITQLEKIFAEGVKS